MTHQQKSVLIEMKKELTAERLHELLHFDPETGLFTRLAARRGNRIGDVAGFTHERGYVVIVVDYKQFYAHRLAWLYTHGKWPEHEIDHRDGNPRNNRLDNLREATRAQNCANTRVSKNNKLQTKGVCAVGKKFRAMIRINGKNKYLGLFTTTEAASAAYAKVANENFKEFARVA